MTDLNLVYADEYGLLGKDHYWENRERFNINLDELKAAGLSNNRIRINKDIVPALLKVDETLRRNGFQLYLKEGYRPKELYELVHRKGVQKFGEENTNRVMNMKKMPHATGRTIDAILWDPKSEREVFMRRNEDGVEAMFMNFYKGKKDAASEQYQKLQELLINTMLDAGFQTGEKKEYYHFTLPPKFIPKPGQTDYTHAKEAPVINCVVKHGDKILLVRRSRKLHFHPSVWNGISGFLDEAHKTAIEKAREELEEEAGIRLEHILSIKEGKIIKQEDAEYGKTWIVHPILTEVNTDKVRLDWESDDHIWIEPKKVWEFDLLPGFDQVIKTFFHV